ncbi:hypothetical protein CKC_01660 [Candidatus Liberibacter solanacearum CLso-ZC1]|uniref:Iron permease FTR1 n=1 Tax=Liberibacter solanacearum (strain CLso-ZC1) TaxID=658172 RepID=E4UCJ3_LIBSC|nr:FTR1 family protein [Candidatus Liberibacter solanacearum]ADR52083.1 hypothetical protein CKC_01660 [Candidatus Liberibacter solanacearum CLso-ZC1]
MGQVLFVVWRESFEALLVIGIIYSWIKRHPDVHNGIKFLWMGIALGIFSSILLALLIYGIFNILDNTRQALFMIFMEFMACILIVHTVYCVNNYGSSTIESNIKSNVARYNWWGITLITMFVIAREGSEIIVFLSGLIMLLTRSNALKFFMEIAGGAICAIITLYVFLLTSRFVSWRIFFKVTSAILLFFCSVILLKAMEESVNLLIEFDYSLPSFLIYPIWSADNLGLIENIISSFFLYCLQSQPTGLSVIAFIIYWVVVISLFSRDTKHV